MLNKTLLASAVTLTFALGAQGVQANPVTNLINGFVQDATSVQLDARRGGSSRRASSTAAKKPATSSSRSVTTNNNNTANSTATNNNTKDAQFNQNRSNQTNTAQNNQTGTNQTGTNQMNGAAPAAAAAPAAGGLGMGSSFLTSLAGAGAGVLLANMLLSPSAAAAEGTQVATPDLLSDDQIKEVLGQIDTDLKDAEKKLLDAAPEDQTAIRDQISKMNELKISLMQEQLNRLQKAS